MQKIKLLAFTLVIPFLFSGCGEEYYSTPQKTLERYVANRMMTNRNELESCLNAFRKEDRKWFEDNYVELCRLFYDRDCPGEGLSTQVTVWTDRFEPAGPTTTDVDSAEIDENNGTAFLEVDGIEVEFVKQRGNWKIKGFFGVVEELAQKYPEIHIYEES